VEFARAVTEMAGSIIISALIGVLAGVIVAQLLRIWT
jgi:hypothetical protein